MSNLLTVTGTVESLDEIREISDTFRTRKVIIKQENGKYPNYYPIEFTNLNIEHLGGIQVGELVEVKFEVSGRKYEKNGQISYFTSLRGLSLIFAGATPGTATGSAAT